MQRPIGHEKCLQFNFYVWYAIIPSVLRGIAYKTLNVRGRYIFIIFIQIHDLDDMLTKLIGYSLLCSTML